MNKLKLVLATFLSIINVGALTLAPVAVSAQNLGSDNAIQDGLSCGKEFDLSKAETTDASCSNPNDEDAGERFTRILRLIVNIFSVIVGVIAVIFVIIGGLKYITSGGESSATASAKNTILFAVVGLAVVALAQFIVRFVFEKVSET